MSDTANQKLSQRLWMEAGKGKHRSLLLETKAKAVALARQLGCVDAENDGCEALMHLLEQTPRHVQQFFVEDASPDTQAFRRWSRVVLRNKIIRLKQVSARLKTHGIDDEGLLEGLASRHDDGPEHWRATPERLMGERDKLVVLLRLILNLKASQRDVLLARMSGFSRRQIAEALTYSEMGQSVLISRLKKQFLGPRDTPSAPCPSLLQNPEEDEPLATPMTPALKAALEDLDGSGGTQLLAAIHHLAPEPQTAYFTRLAGFWDCVVAMVLGQSLSNQVRGVGLARKRLETLLTKRPTPGLSQADGLTCPPSPIPGAQMPSQAEAAYWADLAEVLPEVALQGLLKDPDIWRALRPWHKRPTPAKAPVPSLWQSLLKGLDAGRTWLQPLSLTPAQAMRDGNAPADGHLRLMQFDKDCKDWGNRRCVIWHLKAEALPEQVYPLNAAQKNIAHQLSGRKWRLETAEISPQMLIAWMEESLWQECQSLEAEALAPWIQRQIQSPSGAITFQTQRLP